MNRPRLRFAFSVLAAVTPALASAQTLGQGPETVMPWWRVAAALALCLALAVGAAFALRYRMRGAMPSLTPAKRRLKLVESLRLSHQVDVCLLSCEDRQFLIAATPHGAVLISGGELPPLGDGVT
jgi:hypothetical protein